MDSISEVGLVKLAEEEQSLVTGMGDPPWKEEVLRLQGGWS